MKEDIIREPVELIDEDLDVVAGGGGFVFVSDVNIADIDQSIRQTAFGLANSQAAANVATVEQFS